MTWAQRLKRVFNTDIEVCGRCGGVVRVIVEASNRCIEDQETIDRILDHLRQKEQELPTYTAAPVTTRLDIEGDETMPNKALVRMLNSLRFVCTAQLNRYV